MHNITAERPLFGANKYWIQKEGVWQQIPKEQYNNYSWENIAIALDKPQTTFERIVNWTARIVFLLFVTLGLIAACTDESKAHKSFKTWVYVDSGLTAATIYNTKNECVNRLKEDVFYYLETYPYKIKERLDFGYHVSYELYDSTYGIYKEFVCTSNVVIWSKS